MSNSEKIIITEEDHPEKEWFDEAKRQNLKSLPTFIDHVLNDYIHDYGTVCHAISACALAASYAADKSDCGGITGFQAGFVMWDFVRQWMYRDNTCGLKIFNYDDMLYPSSNYKFKDTISSFTWDAIQKEAKRLLESDEFVSERVKKHWQTIVDGVVPFGYEVVDD